MLKLDLAPTTYYEPSVDQLADVLMNYGDDVVVRGLRTRELRNVTVVYDSRTFPRRERMARRLVVAEGTSYLAGRHSLPALVNAAPLADHSLFTPQMAYGPRLGHQLPRIVRELTADPASRRAVALVSKPADVASPTMPCTTSMQFLVREGHLHTTVGMRSWDLVYGLPVDVGAFSVVAQGIAAALCLVPGSLWIHAGSLHAYEETAYLASGSGCGEVRLDVDFLQDVHRPDARFKALREMMKIDLMAMESDVWTGLSISAR